MTTRPLIVALGALACLLAAPVVAQDDGTAQVEMTPAQLFEFADDARARGDFATAEQAYRALADHPDPDLRNEARFRLARLYADDLGRPADAAVLLRAILDERPNAAPVRLELARVLGLLGDLAGAERELRALQTQELPPEVRQVVRFYASALDAAKPFGAGLELALAPSTNINSGTGNDTLETVIGDFTLSEDAQARSGLGLSLRGQAYGRLPLGEGAQLLGRVSADADIYRESRFDDMALALQLGPEFRLGTDRLAVSATASWRWFGLDPYSFSYGLTGNWRHPLNPVTQLRVDGSALREDNRISPVQSGERYGLSLGLDRAFDAQTGGGARVFASRFHAGDPGFSTASGGASLFVYREFGRTTAVADLAYSHLEADARIVLYPERRMDDRLTLGLAGTFRQFTVGRFAPIVRVRYDRNWSSVGIFDFSSLAAEFGITAAF